MSLYLTFFKKKTDSDTCIIYVLMVDKQTGKKKSISKSSTIYYVNLKGNKLFLILGMKG